VDAVGAKPGDWVICVGSSAAREAAGSKGYPSDLTIVGIIDKWPPEDTDADPAG
jgi:microcompartment protein CcmK/EutM